MASKLFMEILIRANRLRLDWCGSQEVNSSNLRKLWLLSTFLAFSENHRDHEKHKNNWNALFKISFLTKTTDAKSFLSCLKRNAQYWYFIKLPPFPHASVSVWYCPLQEWIFLRLRMPLQLPEHGPHAPHSPNPPGPPHSRCSLSSLLVHTWFRVRTIFPPGQVALQDPKPDLKKHTLESARKSLDKQDWSS